MKRSVSEMFDVATVFDERQQKVSALTMKSPAVALVLVNLCNFAIPSLDHEIEAEDDATEKERLVIYRNAASSLQKKLEIFLSADKD